MRDDKYHRGQLVNILTEGRGFTEDGLATLMYEVGQFGDDPAVLSERIDLYQYPSCNDFHGNRTIVQHGDLATILSFVGRPSQISQEKIWDAYDVYEILVNGKICHAFKWNLSEPLLMNSNHLLLP